MKRKGFTLIELLAVIVILAVLTVIAVPKILDVIENSRKSAAKSSAELYVDAVNKYVAINEVNNKGINIPSDNDLTMGNPDDDIELSKIKIKGDTPDYVTIIFENGKVKEAGFCINDQNVEYKKGNVTISETDYCKFATVESISVNNEISSMETGEEYQLEVSIEPSDVIPVYTSSNTSVAEVSSSGLITAKGPGKTNIIVKAGQKSAIFELEVIKVANEGLLGYIEKTNFVNDSVSSVQIEGVTYSLHTYVYDGNQVWSENKTFGNANDIATEEENAKNMVVVKVNGDLTINEGFIVEPYYSEYGGPKGFVLYVTGTLTNNGEINNNHGAKAEGEDVYLWKNLDATYEYIPAVGAIGGTDPGRAKQGNKGEDGTNRSTAGGGSGGHTTTYNTAGKGGTGTSYSGGSGGGAASGSYSGTAGSSIGGAGGKNTNGSCGVGNPGGSCSTNLSSCNIGSNGTGGLLILYSNILTNNGTITANGTTNVDSSGGSSGGGSINIFYAGSYNNIGTITTNGGEAAGSTYKGGAGGTGSITTCSIATGNCVID